MSEDKKRRRFAELTVCAALAAVVVGLPATSAFADESGKTGGPTKTADGWNRPEEAGLKSEGTIPLGVRDAVEMIIGFSTSVKSWISNTISGWLANDGPIASFDGAAADPAAADEEDPVEVAQVDEETTDEQDTNDEDGDGEPDDPPTDGCDAMCATVYPNPDGGDDGNPYTEYVDPGSQVENPYDQLAVPTDEGTGPWGPASYGNAVTDYGSVAQLAY